jgi:hypothetical protein
VVTYCSIMGPLSLLLYINDIPLTVNIDSQLLLHADDTGIHEVQKNLCLHWII